MNSENLGVVILFIVSVLFAIPFGRYCAKVFKGEKTWLDFLVPLENLLFRLSGVDPTKAMNWKENLKVSLMLNLIFFLWAMLILLTQSFHPFWNPDGISNMEPTTAFNTAVSFMTNTNLQHYSGETGATYLTQLLVFCFLQFVSAATGIAAMASLFKGIVQRQASDLGNFYSLFMKSWTRILLPLSLVIAMLLVMSGTPSTFEGAAQVITLEGDTVNVARGPVAPMAAIKQIGTNGGGYFGPNSTHPFENPDYFTNFVENFAIIIVPIALVFAFGFYISKPKVGYAFFGAMTIVFLTFVAITVYFEMQGNPKITEMGIDNSLGSMEGKEVRFGPAASAMWGVSTTSTSNGSVNSMLDSQTPILEVFIYWI